jgi:hypothetical protein
LHFVQGGGEIRRPGRIIAFCSVNPLTLSFRTSSSSLPLGWEILEPSPAGLNDQLLYPRKWTGKRQKGGVYCKCTCTEHLPSSSSSTPCIPPSSTSALISAIQHQLLDTFGLEHPQKSLPWPYLHELYILRTFLPPLPSN